MELQHIRDEEGKNLLGTTKVSDGKATGRDDFQIIREHIPKLTDLILKDPVAIQKWTSLVAGFTNTANEQLKIKRLIHQGLNPEAINETLEIWISEKGEAATFTALVDILRSKQLNGLTHQLELFYFGNTRVVNGHDSPKTKVMGNRAKKRSPGDSAGGNDGTIDEAIGFKDLGAQNGETKIILGTGEEHGKSCDVLACYRVAKVVVGILVLLAVVLAVVLSQINRKECPECHPNSSMPAKCEQGHLNGSVMINLTTDQPPGDQSTHNMTSNRSNFEPDSLYCCAWFQDSDFRQQCNLTWTPAAYPEIVAPSSVTPSSLGVDTVPISGSPLQKENVQLASFSVTPPSLEMDAGQTSDTGDTSQKENFRPESPVQIHDLDDLNCLRPHIRSIIVQTLNQHQQPCAHPPGADDDTEVSRHNCSHITQISVHGRVSEPILKQILDMCNSSLQTLTLDLQNLCQGTTVSRSATGNLPSVELPSLKALVLLNSCMAIRKWVLSWKMPYLSTITFCSSGAIDLRVLQALMASTQDSASVQVRLHNTSLLEISQSPSFDGRLSIDWVSSQDCHI